MEMKNFLEMLADAMAELTIKSERKLNESSKKLSSAETKTQFDNQMNLCHYSKGFLDGVRASHEAILNTLDTPNKGESSEPDIPDEIMALITALLI